MKIEKKIKCLHCESEIKGNGYCKCKAVRVLNEKVILGAEGRDYIDVSPTLLNEVA